MGTQCSTCTSEDHEQEINTVSVQKVKACIYKFVD